MNQQPESEYDSVVINRFALSDSDRMHRFVHRIAREDKIKVVLNSPASPSSIYKIEDVKTEDGILKLCLLSTDSKNPVEKLLSFKIEDLFVTEYGNMDNHLEEIRNGQVSQDLWLLKREDDWLTLSDSTLPSA